MQARKNLENCIVNEIHKKLSEKLGEVQFATVQGQPHRKGNPTVPTKFGASYIPIPTFGTFDGFYVFCGQGDLWNKLTE